VILLWAGGYGRRQIGALIVLFATMFPIAPPGILGTSRLPMVVTRYQSLMDDSLSPVHPSR
jgi:hypothetical protein